MSKKILTSMAIIIVGATFAMDIGNAATNNNFQATILGSGGPVYDTERHAPSVLISYGRENILVDMGNGTQEGLDENDTKIKSLSGLLLTHHHIDHNEELVPIFIKSLMGGSEFTIVGPPRTKEFIDINEDLYAEDIAYRLAKSKRTLEDLKENYEVRDIEGGENFSLNGIDISTTEVNHSIHTVAYRFDFNGQAIVISGDLSYTASLSELAKGANVLIMDSGDTVKEGETVKINTNSNKNPDKVAAHGSLDEIGRMAGDAGVDTLVLTHFAPVAVDEAATIEELRKNFSGEIIFAVDGMDVIPSGNVTTGERDEEEVDEVIESGNVITEKTTYTIVDTGVVDYYDEDSVISAPDAGDDFFGQDAQYQINNPSYTNNQDGTITDNVTGLIWQQDMGEKLSWEDVFDEADKLNLGGYDDWRVPTLKELYSLIQFNGSVKGEKAVE